MKLETHLLEPRECITRPLEPTGYQFDDYARQLHGGESLALWVKNGRENMLIRIDNAQDFTEAESDYLRQSKPEKWSYMGVRIART